MKFSRMKFKGKGRASVGFGGGSEGMPLIELRPHRYSRLPEQDAEYHEHEWHTARPLDLNPMPTPPERERKRDKFINLLFPQRLGDLATAWRVRIETAHTTIPISATESLAMPTPVYHTGRSRQRQKAEEIRASTKGKSKGRVRFVLDGDEIRDMNLGNGEGSLGRGGSNSGVQEGRVSPLKGWTRVAEFGD